MNRKTLFLAGVFLAALAALLKFAVAPRWTQRIPSGWSWSADYIGFSTYADPVSGEFPVRDVTAVYRRSMQIVDESARPRSITVKDAFTIFDINTGKVLWEYVLDQQVNPATGEHAAPGYSGQILVFPRHVERKTYIYRANYIEGIPLAYQGEEDIEGVKVYRFTYKGRGEYTESYLGTEQYPGVAVAAGQEIKCADDQFTFKVWVEPLTGEILKMDEGCYSGDYIYDIASGAQVSAVLRWAGVTAGDDVLLRAEQIRFERTRLLWLEAYAPLILLSGGLALLAAGLLRRVSITGDQA